MSVYECKCCVMLRMSDEVPALASKGKIVRRTSLHVEIDVACDTGQVIIFFPPIYSSYCRL